MFYSVYKGRNPGIYKSWDQCKDQINGFSGAKFKKFKNYEDALKFSKDGEINKVSSIEKFLDIKHHKHNGKSLIIYTDGSCYGNGNNFALGGYGVYLADDDPRNCCNPIDEYCTNNIAELKAILQVFKIFKKEIEEGSLLEIVTDSNYSKLCFTSYGDKCAKKLWKGNIANKELIKEGYLFCRKFPNIKFTHIHSHTGANDKHSINNDKVDILAKKGMLKAIGLSKTLGEFKFKIGKYRGSSISSIYELDPNYIKWYIKNKPDKRDEVFPIIIETFLNKI